MMNILITGGTGFLGGYLIEKLAHVFKHVYILSRKENFGKQHQNFSNVTYVTGDITNLEVLLISSEERKKLLKDIHVVLHAAALYDLSASYSDCFLQNVVGTQNVISLANSMKNLKAFYHISTIAVGDPNSFFLEENELPKRVNFLDAYSETKYLAEKMIRDNVSKKYVTRIIRPGIIIGDSETAQMPKIDGPYYFIRAFQKYSKILKHLPIVPLSYNPRAKLPIIPVDHCARFISLLLERETFNHDVKTYHLMSSDLPNLKEFLQDLNQMFKLKTEYLPIKENRLYNSLLKLLGIPEEVLPFMFSRLSYDKTSTLEDLPEIKESTYGAFKHILFGKS